MGFFVGHSFAWWRGMFASLGLERVFVSIVPLTVLIGLYGLRRTLSRRMGAVDGLIAAIAAAVGISLLLGRQDLVLRVYTIVFLGVAGVFFILKLRPKPVYGDALRRAFPLVLVLLCGAMPFVQFHMPVALNTEQRLVRLAADRLKAEGHHERRLYFFYPSLALALGIDPFDERRARTLTRVKDDEVEEGSIVVWDGHFGPNEAGVSLDSLLANPGYRLLYSIKPEVPTRTLNDSLFEIYVFERGRGRAPPPAPGR
jgi:hypothetical protein